MDDTISPLPRPCNSGAHVKLNVGGRPFHTTVSTLQSSGPDSLLFALSLAPRVDPIFLDRDPEIFSVILSLLRSNRLPSIAGKFSKKELADEAGYYGVESKLRSAMSPPHLSGIDASLVETIRPAPDSFPTAFTASDDGSLFVAHGGFLSAYDWNLSRISTVRTHIDDLSSLCHIWSDVVAVGSSSEPGLHFYNLARARHVGSVRWTDTSDPRICKARVTVIAKSPVHVFAAFDCPHRENCVMVLDSSTQCIVSEIGRQSGNSTRSMAPAKLTWIPESGTLIATCINCGAFGYSGYVRIWDPRSGSVVWETNEPGCGRSSRFGDSFADVDVDVEGSILFKLCSKSGDLAMADLRFLGPDPWIYMEDKNPMMRHAGGGINVSVKCYKRQVFVGREGSLEVWSRAVEEEGKGDKDHSTKEGLLYRRNFVDKVEDSLRGTISRIEGGGNRLFLGREDVDGVEVWESSHFSRPISVL